MAARHGTHFAALRVATTIKTFGLIRTIRTWFFWAAIREQLLPLTAASHGAVGTTNPRRRCITSAPTTHFLIDCAAASRRAAQPVLPVAATTARLLSEN